MSVDQIIGAEKSVWKRDADLHILSDKPINTNTPDILRAAFARLYVKSIWHQMPGIYGHDAIEAEIQRRVDAGDKRWIPVSRKEE